MSNCRKRRNGWGRLKRKKHEKEMQDMCEWTQSDA